MKGNNPLRTLFDRTQGVTASRQKPLFKPELEGEVVLVYLRTVSPASVMQCLLPPFLGGVCYIFDHAEPMKTQLPILLEEMEKLRSVIKEVSLSIDQSGECSEDLFVSCGESIFRMEKLMTRASALLTQLSGDTKLVECLLRKERVDASGELRESRSNLTKLIRSKLEAHDADACEYLLIGESKKSSESTQLDNDMRCVGHRV